VPRIFWLSGRAGTGKSTVAQSVLEQCRDDERLGGWFFFSRQDTERSNAYRLFTTIARQLTYSFPCFEVPIAQAVKKSNSPGDEPIPTQLRNFIITPLQNVECPPPIVVVIIDALDECSDQDAAQAILRLLATEITKVPVVLKFIITSRPEQHITLGFNRPEMRSVAQAFVLHEIESRIVQDDIRRYLQHHLPWTSTAEMEALVEKAAVLFIFASTAVKFIESEGPNEMKTQLQIVLTAERSMLVSPFPDLDGLYMQVLLNALPKSSTQLLRELFPQMLATIVLLFDPLTFVGLDGLLGNGRGTAKTALKGMKSVLIVPESEDETVRVWHPSFPDFMGDPSRCTDNRFVVNREDHHRRLAICCLKRMSSLTRDICKIGDSLKLNDEIDDLETRVSIYIPADLRYACLHWASHLVHSPPTSDAPLDLLESFLFEHLLHWFEVLSLLGQSGIGVSALRQIRRWCMVCEIVDVVCRTWRFN
jgi:hypothetical protein